MAYAVQDKMDFFNSALVTDERNEFHSCGYTRDIRCHEDEQFVGSVDGILDKGGKARRTVNDDIIVIKRFNELGEIFGIHLPVEMQRGRDAAQARGRMDDDGVFHHGLSLEQVLQADDMGRKAQVEIHTGIIKIRIDQYGGCTVHAEEGCGIHGQRAFSNAALSGDDGNDALFHGKV